MLIYYVIIGIVGIGLGLIIRGLLPKSNIQNNTEGSVEVDEIGKPFAFTKEFEEEIEQICSDSNKAKKIIELTRKDRSDLDSGNMIDVN